MITRRGFLKELGIGAGVAALSPMLDLAPIVPAPSEVAAIEFSGPYEFTIPAFYNLTINNPRKLGVISSIT